MLPFTIITTTCDNIEWVSLFLQSFKRTASDKNIPIVIVDSSAEENYQELLKETLAYSNVTVQRICLPSLMDCWNAGITSCDADYILFCHIDILFLANHWDTKLTSYINKRQIIGIANEEDADVLWYRSLFMFGPKEYFEQSQFKHTVTNKNDYLKVMPRHVADNHQLIEHASLTYIAVAAGKANFIAANQMIKPFGEIIYFEEQEWIYHSLYSSRIKQDSKCKIPSEEYETHVSYRNFDRDIKVLHSYDGAMPIKQYLEDYIKANPPKYYERFLASKR
jgi:hypothetical protein